MQAQIRQASLHGVNGSTGSVRAIDVTVMGQTQSAYTPQHQDIYSDFHIPNALTMASGLQRDLSGRVMPLLLCLTVFNYTRARSWRYMQRVKHIDHSPQSNTFRCLEIIPKVCNINATCLQWRNFVIPHIHFLHNVPL